jgi:hypothetical protein
MFSRKVAFRLLSKINDHEVINMFFVTQSPAPFFRNLEFMGIENKTDGWWLQYPRRDYWHK